MKWNTLAKRKSLKCLKLPGVRICWRWTGTCSTRIPSAEPDATGSAKVSSGGPAKVRCSSVRPELRRISSTIGTSCFRTKGCTRIRRIPPGYRRSSKGTC
uniref:(northern house mosquito) hypothetical protein n=1 Tax=Culex pipiens TaxID=7175 RepID=A0A8D8JPK9_CULPI